MSAGAKKSPARRLYSERGPCCCRAGSASSLGQGHRVSARWDRRAFFRFALIVVAIVSASGCTDVVHSLGSSPAAARANADALLFSLGSRFGPVQPAPGYEDLRSKLSASISVPSRLYNDTTIWSASNGNTRELVFTGRAFPGGYLLGEPRRAAPREPGDYSRTTRLRNLGENQFEWTVRDELATGPMLSSEMSAAIGELFEAAERHDVRSVRTIYERNLPQTTRALGRLLELDSIALTPATGGGTQVFLAIRSHPERIAQELPDLSRFLRRYGSPLQVEMSGEDESGTSWWVADIDRDRTTLRFRVHDKRLAPLNGLPSPLPDRLLVRMSASTRIRIFDIGASDLVASVAIDRDVEQPGITATFRDEPQWHFPLLVERIIRSSLRRPFAGEGASLDMRITRDAGRTTLVRVYRITVQESAILRWLGGLGSSTFNDFREGAEPEYDRFVGEFYNAARQDISDLPR